MYSSKFLKSIKLKILNLKNFKIENFKKSWRKVRMSKIMRTPIKLGLRTCATCVGCAVLNHGVGVSRLLSKIGKKCPAGFLLWLKFLGLDAGSRKYRKEKNCETF